MNKALIVLILLGVIVFPTLAQNEATLVNPLDGDVYHSPQGAEYSAQWDRWTLSQQNLPDGSEREAHEVTISVPEGFYVLDAVECLVETQQGRLMARENGVIFRVRDGVAELTVDCNEGAASGFSIYREGFEPWAGSDNPLAGIRFSSETAPEYDILVGGADGTWWYQKWLPSYREAHEVTLYLWPETEYIFDGQLCVLSYKGVDYFGEDSGIEFSTGYGDDLFEVTVSCEAGYASGFSIYPNSDFSQYIDWDWNSDSEESWEKLKELLELG